MAEAKPVGDCASAKTQNDRHSEISDQARKAIPTPFEERRRSHQQEDDQTDGNGNSVEKRRAHDNAGPLYPSRKHGKERAPKYAETAQEQYQDPEEQS